MTRQHPRLPVGGAAARQQAAYVKLFTVAVSCPCDNIGEPSKEMQTDHGRQMRSCVSEKGRAAKGSRGWEARELLKVAPPVV